MARAKLALGLIALFGIVAAGCSGGDEGAYTGPTKTYPNATKKPQPARRGGGTSMPTATP